MILSSFRGPGAHFGSLGTHFEDISDFYDFEDAPGAKTQVTFETLFRHCLQFLCFVCQLFLHEFWHGLKELFLRMLDDFEELWEGFLDHFSGRSAKTKKCLDCTGVCGLHIQLSRK